MSELSSPPRAGVLFSFGEWQVCRDRDCGGFPGGVSVYHRETIIASFGSRDDAVRTYSDATIPDRVLGHARFHARLSG